MSAGFHDLHKRKVHKYGWRKGIPDIRDQYLRLSTPGTMPAESDVFAQHNPPVYDQGQAGSCTGQGTRCAFQFERMRQGLPDWIPSALFIYYGARYYEGTTDQDAGAEIRDAVKVVAKLGCPPETDWPYDLSKLTVKPSREAYKDALHNQVLTYYRVTQNLSLMKACLAAGFPIIIGFSVYESFESDQVAQTGVVPMPHPDEQLLGGHCVVVYGHDDKAGVFRCRNSWGTSWGNNGNFTMPYQYLTNANLSSDFWTIRLVEAPKS